MIEFLILLSILCFAFSLFGSDWISEKIGSTASTCLTMIFFLSLVSLFVVELFRVTDIGEVITP